MHIICSIFQLAARVIVNLAPTAILHKLTRVYVKPGYESSYRSANQIITAVKCAKTTQFINLILIV